MIFLVHNHFQLSVWIRSCVGNLLSPNDVRRADDAGPLRTRLGRPRKNVRLRSMVFGGLGNSPDGLALVSPLPLALRYSVLRPRHLSCRPFRLALFPPRLARLSPTEPARLCMKHRHGRAAHTGTGSPSADLSSAVSPSRLVSPAPRTHQSLSPALKARSAQPPFPRVASSAITSSLAVGPRSFANYSIGNSSLRLAKRELSLLRSYSFHLPHMCCLLTLARLIPGNVFRVGRTTVRRLCVSLTSIFSSILISILISIDEPKYSRPK